MEGEGEYPHEAFDNQAPWEKTTVDKRDACNYDTFVCGVLSVKILSSPHHYSLYSLCGQEKSKQVQTLGQTRLA